LKFIYSNLYIFFSFENNNQNLIQINIINAILIFFPGAIFMFCLFSSSGGGGDS